MKVAEIFKAIGQFLVDGKFGIYCPYCPIPILLELDPPKGARKLPEFGPERTTAICKVCGRDHSYWARSETYKKSWETTRRLCIYRKLNEVISQEEAEAGKSFEINCAICGIRLVLPPPKGKRPKPKFGYERSAGHCKVCETPDERESFEYWGEIHRGEYFVYTRYPNFWQRFEAWQHRLKSESGWFKCPIDRISPPVGAK